MLPIRLITILTVILLTGGKAERGCHATDDTNGSASDTIRFATYNVSMFRPSIDSLVSELRGGNSVQIRRVARVVQEVRPDVLALMEFDYDSTGTAIDLFRENYLEVPWKGGEPISYPHAYQVPSNTGILSGYDLNNDGTVALPEDGFGFGRHPGQYAFALLSRYPLDIEGIRSFRLFRWTNMPGARLPVSADGNPYYNEEEREVFRLSSKNHIDIPVYLPGDHVVHVILAHPTPPVFDGSEDRNGLRNYDEIRLIADYVTGARYPVDDQGASGGLGSDTPFVVMGDLNADPDRGDSVHGAMDQLLRLSVLNPAVTYGDHIPVTHAGRDNPRATSFFGLRTDYVLPSSHFDVAGSGIFFPGPAEPLHDIVADRAASDHLMVWVDVVL